MKSFELHRIMDAARRRAAFEALEPKVWLEKSIFTTLVIADAAIIADVMRSPNFRPADLRRLTTELSRRNGVALAHVKETMSLLPLLLEGDEHMRIRKLLASFLATKSREIEPALPVIVRDLLDALPARGEADLVSGLIDPLVRGMFSKLAGRELTDEIMSFALVTIFEGRQTLSSLIRLDHTLERVYRFLDRESADDEEFICHLLCLVFGVDNVFSTLGENLAAAFQASNGVSPAELPPYPAEGMIASVHRQPLEATEIAGHPVHPGMLLRLQLAPTGYSGDKSLNAALFGVGRHACIGKQLSLIMWKHLSEQFNARRIRGRITDYRSHSTHTFNFVQALKVSIES